MNASLSPRPICIFLLILLGLGCLSLLAPPLMATDTDLIIQNTAPATAVQASALKDVLGNRSRMIQASLVLVVFGCALLWWRR